MHIPSSTYRVQLHKDFSFKQLDGIIDYLHGLGITTIYASPVTRATPGSQHGYDVTDPHQLNPEIGTLEEWQALSRKLKDRNMLWLQDIVPNHMSFHHTNTRLMDALERGPLSPYYTYFDINWQHPAPELEGKLLAPFLGDIPENCVARGEIKLSFSEKGFQVSYLDNSYPLSLPAFKWLLQQAPADMQRRLSPDFDHYAAQATLVKQLPDWLIFKTTWAGSLLQAEGKKEMIDNLVTSVNSDAAQLQTLLDEQYYTWQYWKEADRHINYRRFFTVTTLLCLRMEDEAVFNDYHTAIYNWYQQGLIQGVRIDHIDGLYEPADYIARLRKLLGDDCYIVAEKILEAAEVLPANWPLQGTSGYEFLAYGSQVLTNQAGAQQLVNYYQSLLPQQPTYDQEVYNNKKLILERYMMGEWDNLLRYFTEQQLAQHFEAKRLKSAIGELMLALPVYRIYPAQLPLPEADAQLLAETFAKAMATTPELTAELAYLQSLFLLPDGDDAVQQRALSFLKRLMQFTGPLTAKGVEDTTFYKYNPLIAHNEVGDTPAIQGIATTDFHSKMAARQQTNPLSLNATATHDTKRGEDARLRIALLSNLPGAWIEQVQQWRQLNSSLVTAVNDQPAPSVNEEYFLYQTLAGSLPVNEPVTDEWKERLQAYLLKAIREAKVNTAWEAPVEAYENAFAHFTHQLLAEDQPFLQTARPFIEQVADRAIQASTVQTVIKLTAPGIPDIYQGSELWDLSFVDPDNRRPVNYEERKQWLAALQQKKEEGREALQAFVQQHRKEGIEKMLFLHTLLLYRRAHAELFIQGDYLPLTVSGTDRPVLAYARRHEKQWLLVVMLLSCESDTTAVTGHIAAQASMPGKWHNLVTRNTLTMGGALPLQALLQDSGAGVWQGEME